MKWLTNQAENCRVCVTSTMGNEGKRDSGRPQERWEWSVWFLVSLVFFSAQLLLPVERGFAVIKLFGAPLYLPMIIDLVGIILIFLRYPKRIFLSFSRPWVVLNLVFAIFSFFASVISTSWEISLFYSYVWISNFIFCYLIVELLLEKIKLKGLVLVICIVAVCQIAIGIMEGFFQTRFLIYASPDYLLSMGAVVLGERGTTWDPRILGTLGNPILFGTALMLSIPFLAKLNHKLIRSVLICMASFVALMSLSRTVFLFFGCYLVSYFYKSSVSKKVVATVAILIIFMGVMSIDSPLSRNWAMRLEEERDAQEMGGVEMRKNMAIHAFEETLISSGLWGALFGHGWYSSSEIANQYLEVSTTIDNAYVTILYETGLIGLILYLVICSLPLRNIRGRDNSLLVAGYVGILLCGFSFVTHREFSINLLAMTILVVISRRGLMARDRRVYEIMVRKPTELPPLSANGIVSP